MSTAPIPVKRRQLVVEMYFPTRPGNAWQFSRARWQIQRTRLINSACRCRAWQFSDALGQIQGVPALLEIFDAAADLEQLVRSPGRVWQFLEGPLANSTRRGI